MKKSIISLLFLLMFSKAYAQVFPEGMSYQAQVFSSTGAILSNVNIGVEFNIRSSSLVGPIVWQETNTVLLNDVGHFSTVVGSGVTTGAGSSPNFSDIDWSQGPYFIELLVDEANVGSYVSTMTQQLMAVPFAYHSKTSSQTYSLSGLDDVDTSGLQVGDVLEWDGTSWIAANDDFTSNSDTAQYAFYADTSTYADTAFYADNCVSNGYADTALYAYFGDTANFSTVSNHAAYSDSSSYADTAGVANYSIGNWGLNGNSNTDGITNYLGTTDSIDLIFQAYATERMRIKANGRIGIGTTNPLADFHVNNTDGVLFTGTFGTGSIPTQGSGTRMMWYPGKAAFRSGYVVSVNWDDINVGDYSFAAGYNNRASGDYSAAFGNATTAAGEGSFAVGNASNAQGIYSIAMGHNPTALGDYGVAIGRGATANAESAVAIGYHPEVFSDYGLGFGNYVKVYGENGVAMGYQAHCMHDGSFIYSDQSTPLGTIQTTAANQFMVRASGGTIFYTSANLSTGVVLPAGGGAWSSLSDRNMKENIALIDPKEYLDKLDEIDVFKWNYITQDSSIAHIGPMAQDFYAVFNIGEDSTLINSLDFDGINLLLIKALHDKSVEIENQQVKISDMADELEDLKEKRNSIALKLLDLESKIEDLDLNEIGANGEK